MAKKNAPAATEEKLESTQPAIGADLPAWKCHKIVRAAKIVGVEGENDESGVDEFFGISVEHPESGVYVVDAAWVEKHMPEVGGYWVIYEDGYQSYSPAEPFESGYTLLEKVILAEENSKCGCDKRPVEQAGPKAPLVEAESILAWLKTQPSTPENKSLRAQAGIVVDYLKGA